MLAKSLERLIFAVDEQASFRFPEASETAWNADGSAFRGTVRFSACRPIRTYRGG